MTTAQSMALMVTATVLADVRICDGAPTECSDGIDNDGDEIDYPRQWMRGCGDDYEATCARAILRLLIVSCSVAIRLYLPAIGPC